MKVIIGKCHFLSSLAIYSKMTIGNFSTQNSDSQIVLGVTIDRNFKLYLTSNLFRKVSMKIAGLARIFSNMTMKQGINLMKVYFISQLGYCPLFWINHCMSLNNRMNILPERALRLVCNDFISSFAKLLENDNSVTIHQRNLQTLLVEKFIIKRTYHQKF